MSGKILRGGHADTSTFHCGECLTPFPNAKIECGHCWEGTHYVPQFEDKTVWQCNCGEQWVYYIHWYSTYANGNWRKLSKRKRLK